ncbi:MAG: glycerol-3-phosphate 1-O-acyltransferase PlsY [Kiritimatiellaceae bacterium]|nr:glycerol-3-phosphate 1-O-acyltransferase PlsY [Kiritimatiellaceae bacterium]
MNIAILTIVAYLFGAIPFGLLIAKSRGIDIRSQGSGNIGATNVFRVIGKGWGIFTFALDALKGFIPAFFFPMIGNLTGDWGMLFGLITILGHTFPIYLKFKGGKGVATSAGVLLGIAPLAVGIGFACWLVVVFVSRYVSLASVIAAMVVGVVVWIDPKQESLIIQCSVTLMSILVVWLHRANIKRLVNGTENRFGKKKESAA